MGCYRPIKGWRTIEKTDKGKRSFTTNSGKAYLDMRMTIPCGQCIGCRLEKSRQWAIRCVCEAETYDHNCFVTLTYNEEHLPKDNSLHLEDMQNFFKRLRKKYRGLTGVYDEKRNRTIYPIKYYQCGEYGENYSRPHYHACIFNFDFSDKELYRDTGENKLYTSEECTKLWGKGHVILGDVTFHSAAYVARYIMKKINKSSDDYTRINIIDGEVKAVVPEFATMSRNPGIGKHWYEMWKSDVYPHDFFVINGKKVRPPKYFDKLLEEENSLEYLLVKAKREKNALDEFHPEKEYDRLLAKEKFKNLQIKTCLKRSYENE